MHTVGAKLGFGLHYHRTGKIVPPGGFVETRFRTNAKIYLGGLPPELMQDLGPVAVLAQGEWTSDGHFGYRPTSSADGTLGIYVAHLGRAFITISSVAFDAKEMPATTSGQALRSTQETFNRPMLGLEVAIGALANCAASRHRGHPGG